jgi:hypothetical protein
MDARTSRRQKILTTALTKPQKFSIFIGMATLLEKTLQMLPKEGNVLFSNTGARLDGLLDDAKNSDESIDEIPHFSRNPSVIWTN